MARKRDLRLQVAHRLTTALRDFFFASGAEESGDHLVEVVRRDPAAAMWFIELTTLFSIIGGLVSATACGIFFVQHWDRCGNCGRPLRWWLIGQIAMQTIQLPVRAVLYSSVRALSRNTADWTIEACVISLTASRAWQMSKMVSLILYGWFVLGVVWWMHSSHCEGCPGITTLTASVLMLSAARTVVTCLISRGLFTPNLQAVQAAAPKVEGATSCQIEALPLVRVVLPPSGGGSSNPKGASRCEQRRLSSTQSPGNPSHFSTCVVGDSCAVCLSDFELEQMARRLPCRHHFHSDCIERWLLQNKRCPLCMHPVDKVCHLVPSKNE